MKLFRKRLSEKKGATIIEYVYMAVVISTVGFNTIVPIGNSIAGAYGTLAATLGVSPVGNAPGSCTSNPGPMTKWGIFRPPAKTFCP